MDLRKRQWVGGLILVAVFSAMFAAVAGEVENQGRAILEKNQKAVVTVQLVIKQKMSMGPMGSRDDESKTEATGFVVDPSGLTVLALSETDPSGLYENMLSGMGRGAENFKMESSVSDVKLLLDDGKEIPAQVVLRDKDLDLAFVRPTEKPATPMAALDLTQAGQPEMLDQVVALNRLGKVANRAYSANLERIQAVVLRPRKFYVPGNDPTHTGLGSPVFTLDGKLVGMVALRTTKGEGKGGLMSAMGGFADSMMPVVVPVADILEAAKQAPAEAPKEAPKEAPEENKTESAPEPAPKS